jgi:hypothetical protein
MALLKDGRYQQCMQQSHATPDCDLRVTPDDLHLAATNIEAEDLLDLWNELEAHAPADSSAPPHRQCSNERNGDMQHQYYE